MELQHRLCRQAINIAVGKAMEDMPANARRSLRNLIDLSLLFAKGENHQRFFAAARQMIEHPQNPYIALAKRIISDLDAETVKRVGLNLGYSSLTYGAHKLKKIQDGPGDPVPWLLILDSAQAVSACFDRMKRFIRESRDLGIYSYIACPHSQDDLFALCEMAGSFEECLFGLKVPAGLISGHTAGALGQIHNAVVSVEGGEDGLPGQSQGGAFRLLKQHRCLFGVHVRYNEGNLQQVATAKFIRSAIGLGNLFAVYSAEDGVSEPCRDAVYAFVRRTRGENGLPLITLEWPRDMRCVSAKILSGDGYTAIDLAANAHCPLQSRNRLPHPLWKILCGLRSCPTL